MKLHSRFFALLTALLMLLACCACADNLFSCCVDNKIIDLGSFTLTLQPGQVYQLGPMPLDENLTFLLGVYPVYDERSPFNPALSVVRSEERILSALPDEDEAFRQFASANGESITAQSLFPFILESCEVLDTVTLGGTEFHAVEYLYRVDYTQATGGVLGQYQLKNTTFITDLPEGSYIFSLNSYSDEDHSLLLTLMDTLTPKTDEQPALTEINLGSFSFFARTDDHVQSTYKDDEQSQLVIYPAYDQSVSLHNMMYVAWYEEDPMVSSFAQALDFALQEQALAEEFLLTIIQAGFPTTLKRSEPICTVSVGSRDFLKSVHVFSLDYSEISNQELGWVDVYMVRYLSCFPCDGSYELTLMVFDESSLQSMEEMISRIVFQ